jgi:hypothetical protein
VNVDLASVRIARAIGEGVDDPFADVLADLGTADGAPDVRLRVFRGAREPLEVQQFFFDEVRGAQDERGVHLDDGWSHVRVSGDGASVDVVLGDGPAPDAFHARTKILALVFALARRGVFHVHAGAVISGPTTIAIVGESGAGKTTTTLALATEGATLLSDDAVFVRDGLHALRIPLHVTERTLRAFPAIASRVGGRVAGKWLVSGDAFARVNVAAPPDVLLFPRVTDADATCVVRVSEADAFGKLLAASAWCALPGAPRRREHLDVLAQLVARAHRIELALGKDALSRPAIVSNLVAAELAKTRR